MKNIMNTKLNLIKELLDTQKYLEEQETSYWKLREQGKTCRIIVDIPSKTYTLFFESVVDKFGMMNLMYAHGEKMLGVKPYITIPIYPWGMAQEHGVGEELKKTISLATNGNSHTAFYDFQYKYRDE